MFDEVGARIGSLMVAATIATACGNASSRALEPSYEPYTGRLIQLSADQDGDGRIDQWTYLDGTRPLRGEKDVDGDGRIDRWEYFDAQAALLKVGTASGNDGIEDTWTWVSRANGEGRVDISTAHDRHIDRREYYVETTRVRAELDTNADGRIDRWDRFENGVLREVQFDTSLNAARADRRLTYDARGQFVAAEADDDRDGRFERPLSGASANPPGAVIK